MTSRRPWTTRNRSRSSRVAARACFCWPAARGGCRAATAPPANAHAARGERHRRADRQAGAAAGRSAAARSDGWVPASAAGGAVVAARAGAAGWRPTIWCGSSPRRSIRPSAGGSPARDFKVIAPADAVHAGRPRRAAARSIRPAIGATTVWCSTVTSIDASARREDLQDDPAAAERGVPGPGQSRTATSISAVRNALDILLDTPVVKGSDRARRRRRRRLGLRGSGSGSADADAEATAAHGPGEHRRVAGVAARAARTRLQ